MDKAAILRFQTLLEADLENLQQILQLLHGERSALESRNLEALEKLTVHKTLLLEALDRTAAEREALLQQLGVQADAEALVRFFGLPEVVEHAPEMESAWEQLRQILREVRHQNIVNGTVIQRSRQTINSLLDVIRGNVNQRQTYDQHGCHQQGMQGAEIARA